MLAGTSASIVMNINVQEITKFGVMLIFTDKSLLWYKTTRMGHLEKIKLTA